MLRGTEGRVEEDKQQNQPVEGDGFDSCAAVSATDTIPAAQSPTASQRSTRQRSSAISLKNTCMSVNSPAADLHHPSTETKQSQ